MIVCFGRYFSPLAVYQRKYQPCGKRSQGRPLKKDFWTVNVTGTGREAKRPASCLMMMMMMMMMS